MEGVKTLRTSGARLIPRECSVFFSEKNLCFHTGADSRAWELTSPTAEIETKKITKSCEKMLKDVLG